MRGTPMIRGHGMRNLIRIQVGMATTSVYRGKRHYVDAQGFPQKPQVLILRPF